MDSKQRADLMALMLPGEACAWSKWGKAKWAENALTSYELSETVGWC